MPDATRSQPPILLDDGRTALRLHHSSMHTEGSSVEEIVRCVRFHGTLKDALWCISRRGTSAWYDAAAHAERLYFLRHVRCTVVLYR